MQKSKQFAGIVAGIAAVLALKLYGKALRQDDARDSFVRSCQGEAACTAAVSSHFDDCFERSYKAGNPTAKAVDVAGLSSCLNSRAGAPLFAAGASPASAPVNAH